jgi:ubiquinone/menaquinone biosynthesis C-methylase UbiE
VQGHVVDPSCLQQSPNSTATRTVFGGLPWGSRQCRVSIPTHNTSAVPNHIVFLFLCTDTPLPLTKGRNLTTTPSVSHTHQMPRSTKQTTALVPRVTTWSTAIQLCVVIVLLLLLTTLALRCVARLSPVGANHTHNAAHEPFANPKAPGAPEPITDIPEDILATYASEHKSTPASIYDANYARLYQTIVEQPKQHLVHFEVEDLIARTRLREYGTKATVVDLGCGTGAHLNKLAKELPDAQFYGVDQSPPMLAVARKKVRSHGGRVRLMQADMNDADALYKGMCTHLVCYYFSFYYTKSSRTFFENAHKWIQPNGYLCVHLVDPYKFDPVPEVANPLRGISLQRYHDQRKTGAKVIIKQSTTSSTTPTNRIYTCNFEHQPKTRTAVFTESIIDPHKERVRRHTTTLHMPHHEAVVQSARKAGFRLRHVTSLLEIGDEYEFLCYLQRDDKEG